MTRASTETPQTNGSTSRQSSTLVRSSLTRSATFEAEAGHISLVDHTKPENPPREDELSDLPTNRENEPTRTSTNIDPVSRTATHGSLRESIARRKYRKYQEERTVGRTHSRNVSEDPGDGKPPPQQNGSSDHGTGEDGDSRWGVSRIDRGKAKVGEFVRGKKAAKARQKEVDSAVDVLYENQRGAFFCGIPRFSSASLLQFDPPAWLDGHFKPSAVNITNAQVPDPSWSWDWRTWYVDMSHDVDEEGWEYSFWFFKGCSWHGTHPWFHSFVRRRRWLRKRVRMQGQQKAKEEAHALNPDYFTIHTKGARSVNSEDGVSDSRRSRDLMTASRRSEGWGAASWQSQMDDEDIENIPALMRALGKASIDREKVRIVKKFVESGGDELFYLADEISHIMSLLVFQTSRRQLLAYLMEKLDALSEDTKANAQPDDPDTDLTKRNIENLRNAVDKADEHCKRLEYWSDVRDIVRDGYAANAVAEEKGWGQEWEGIDASGPNPDAVDADNDDDDEDKKEDDKKDAKGKGKAIEAEGPAQPKTEDSHKGRKDEPSKTASGSAGESEEQLPAAPPVKTDGLTAVQPQQIVEEKD